MCAPFDEQEKVQAGAIAQASARVAWLDGLERRARRDEVLGHAVTPTLVAARMSAYCGSYCNVNPVRPGSCGIIRDKKKAPRP